MNLLGFKELVGISNLKVYITSFFGPLHGRCPKQTVGSWPVADTSLVMDCGECCQ